MVGDSEHALIEVLLPWLRLRFQSSKYVREFNLLQTRADLVILNEAIHGFEVKSASDNFKRLPKQVKDYDSVLDYNTLVTRPSMIEEGLKRVPAHWGVIEISHEGVITQVREPQHHSRRTSKNLAWMFWLEELRSFTKLRSMTASLRKLPKYRACSEISKQAGVEDIASHLRACLPLRENSRWRDL